MLSYSEITNQKWSTNVSWLSTCVCNKVNRQIGDTAYITLVIEMLAKKHRGHFLKHPVE